MEERACPFKIGDQVRFVPNAHAYGWAWSSLERMRLQPGDIGVVTRIERDGLILDDERGGFDWECFERA
jgi:hypothetical protein